MKNLKLIALGMILFTAIGCKDSKITPKMKTVTIQRLKVLHTVVNDSTKVSFATTKQLTK
jgi:hypothetical protein